jgi:hypothetical protein
MSRDHENIRGRLYSQCARLMSALEKSEEMALKDRLAIVAGVRSVMASAC